MGNKSKSQVVGYRYILGLHAGLCRGPVDQIVSIEADGIPMLDSPIDDDDDVVIDKPNLFGGDEKEGGIVGGLSVLMGTPSQSLSARTVPASAYSGSRGITSMLTGLVGSFRGALTVFFRGQVCVNNPYPKAWRFRLRRNIKGWQDDAPWYAERAKIVLTEDGNEVWAQNPAHIIWECMTSEAWGKGFDPSVLDEPAWMSAANILCDEGFGLCALWDRQSSIEDFIKKVVDTIAAVVYVDMEIGKITIRLLRANYSVSELPVFDTNSGLLNVQRDDTGASDNMFNELIVNYTSAPTGGKRSVRGQNIAGFQAVGEVFSTTKAYEMIPTAGLALRVAQRDALIAAMPLKRFKLTLDRRAWRLALGAPFRISDPTRGIADIVLRVAKKDDSGLEDGTITVVAIEDVFALDSTSFITPPESAWVPPQQGPAEITRRYVRRAAYRDLVLAVGDSEAQTAAEGLGGFVTHAETPSGLSPEYAVYSRTGTDDYVSRARAAYTSTAILDVSVDEDETEFEVSGWTLTGDIEVGQGAIINDEFLRVTAFDVGAGTLTVARGCVDTPPQPHSSGSVVWFCDTAFGTDEVDYATGEEVDVKVAARTYTTEYPIADTAEDTVEIEDLTLPYCAANVKLNGKYPWAVSIVETVSGIDLVITWAHRDRLLQSDQVVSWSESSVGPEAGVTYSIELEDGGGVFRSVTGLTGTTWTYTTSMATSDGAISVFTLRLITVRGSATARHVTEFAVDRNAGFDEYFDLVFN